MAHALVELSLVSEAFREGRLSYSKVRAITRVARAENEALLVEMALSATAAQIEKIVRKYRQVERLQMADRAQALYENRSVTYHWAADGSLVLHGRLTPEQGAVLVAALESAEIDTPVDEPRSARQADALVALAQPGSTADHVQITVHVSAETLQADGVVDPEDPPCIEDGPAIAPETVRRLACDAALVPLIEGANAEALAIGRRTRAIGPALRRALKRRDAGCRFPGCSSVRFVDGHHIRHWADGGETRLDNLVLLCGHHHRLVHEGGFRVERTAAGSFNFYDASGLLVPATAERRFRGNVCSLFEANTVAIDAGTTVPRWHGEHPDYDHILWVMSQRTTGYSAVAGQAMPPLTTEDRDNPEVRRLIQPRRTAAIHRQHHPVHEPRLV